MSTNIEIEAKILVNEKEFNQLKTLLQIDEKLKVTQTNYYVDDQKGSLRSYGFALRIRELAQTYTLTLKSPMAEGTLEKNQQISKEAYLALQNQSIFPVGLIKDFLEMFGFDTSTLKIITFLTTDRYETKFEGRHVCLDKNTYHGLVDYEIESEESSLKNAAETLKLLCEKANIEYKANQISKYARAIKTLK
ncbi:MAG: CYTH domain-containing protein [Bacilli bacterium]